MAAPRLGAPGAVGGHDQQPPDGLTQREIEILALLAEGASNATIGRTLFLSPGTVHWYTVRIYQKLGVRGRAEAAAYAVRHGVLARSE